MRYRSIIDLSLQISEAKSELKTATTTADCYYIIVAEEDTKNKNDF